MRRLIYHVAITADGFIAREDGTFDCFPTEGDHVADYLEMLESYGAVLMGRKTYEVGLQVGVANPYPHLRSYVFSRTMQAAPHPDVQVVSANAIEVVRGLKGETGADIYLCGGATLATDLFRERLVDEVRLKVNPLLLGSGLPLVYDIGRPLDLELVGSKTYGSGVVLLSYQPRALST